MRVKDNNYYQKKLVYKLKNNFRKPTYRYFQDRKNIKNIDNNIGYESPSCDNILTIYKKNNEISLNQMKKSETLDRFEKENNINKNNVSAYSIYTLNSGIQNNTLYNKLIFNPSLENSHNYIMNKRNLSPITGINNDSKINNSNQINKNNITNNFYINSNLNQTYNFNISNKKQLQNYNNAILNQRLNHQIIAQPYSTIATGIDLNELNTQNQIINNREIKPKIININIQNRIPLDRNLNSHNKKKGNGYKLVKRVNNFTNFQNNFLSLNYETIHQDKNKNMQIPLTYNQILNQDQIQNNISNIGDAKLNNITNITDINKGVINPLSNQIDNLGFKTSEGINNEIINNLNNINSIQNNINPNIMNNRATNIQNNVNSNMISNRLTILPNNNIFNNITTNNLYNNNTTINQGIDPLVKELINQETNQVTNQEINSILNNSNPAFQTLPQINQNNLIDNYINNQHYIMQQKPLNTQNQFNIELTKQQMQKQNSLITEETNPYINVSTQENPHNLRLTLANNNILTNLQNDYINQEQDVNQFLNDFFQSQNSYLNQPSSQGKLFSQNNDNFKEILNNIPIEGKILKSYSASSRPGNNKMGISKTNQDSFISKLNINNINDFNIFGVLDGHGPSGHFVSKFSSLFILNYIMNNPEIKNLTNLESIYFSLKKNNYQIIKQSFMLIDNILKTQKFDSKESGSTCVLIIQIGKNIICANVGDSRAIAVFDESNDKNLNNLEMIPLSIDYKPELPEEKERILMSGGSVEQLKSRLGIGIGPYRVFAPGEDYPGLAMSRSIGDFEGKNFGIISEPGIIEYNIKENTKFIVICSDGVWEFLENEHVKNVGKNFYLNNDPNGFIQELITQSVIEWKANDDIIDDITAIVLYF